MPANYPPIEHNKPITINEALERMIPDADECYVLDAETLNIGKTLILCSDHQNGYFFTDIDTNEKYYTLEDLRNAGIEIAAMTLEYTLETSKETEETFRK